jgi:hypothetical protein
MLKRKSMKALHNIYYIYGLAHNTPRILASQIKNHAMPYNQVYT